jgi:hypothetical protein
MTMELHEMFPAPEDTHTLRDVVSAIVTMAVLLVAAFWAFV